MSVPHRAARSACADAQKLKELLATTPKILPSVNQIEVHPFNTRTELTAYCEVAGITVEAYAPLAKGLRFNHQTIIQLSNNYGCTPAQLMVRWSLQHGYICLPKSVRKERIAENADIGWFEISPADIETMDALDEYLVTESVMFSTITYSQRKNQTYPMCTLSAGSCP
jgi:diketogulonate reductase-like aldo/keto reductase